MRRAFVVKSPRVTALRGLNYTPEVEAFRAKTTKGRCKPFGQLLDTLGPNYGSVFTRIDCQPSHGIDLISQSDMFATEPMGRVIRQDCIPNPEAHRVKRWQVLIAGAGTLGETELYGRSIMADNRLVGRYVGPHAMTMTFREPGSPESLYAYAFLCTNVGIRCVRAASYGTKILSLRKEMLLDLPVPIAADEIVNSVAESIRTAVEKRELFSNLMAAARGLIERDPDFQIASSMCAEAKAKVVSTEGADISTLSAWNYASSGGAMQYLRRKWSCRLGDLTTRGEIYYGPRFARIPCEEPYGLPFLSQRDVFLIRPVPRRIVHPGFQDRMLFVGDNTLLVAGHGTTGEGEIFGKVAFPTKQLIGSAFTQDILRINIEPSHSHVAAVFFSTPVGMRLLRSAAVGTKIMTLRFDLLRDLPFPDIHTDVASEIRQLLMEAVRARDLADAAEANAVGALEREVLPRWLN